MPEASVLNSQSGASRGLPVSQSASTPTWSGSVLPSVTRGDEGLRQARGLCCSQGCPLGCPADSYLRTRLSSHTASGGDRTSHWQVFAQSLDHEGRGGGGGGQRWGSSSHTPRLGTSAAACKLMKDNYHSPQNFRMRGFIHYLGQPLYLFVWKSLQTCRIISSILQRTHTCSFYPDLPINTFLVCCIYFFFSLNTHTHVHAHVCVCICVYIYIHTHIFF